MPADSSTTTHPDPQVSHAAPLHWGPWSHTIDAAQLREYIYSLPQRQSLQRPSLLQDLIWIQDRFGWIPALALEQLSQQHTQKAEQIRAVIDFYSFLSDRFQGQFRILLSDNITDRMGGQHQILERLCQRLGVAVGEVRDDGRVSIDLTSCTGLCDQGPAALINGYPMTALSLQRADAIAQLVDAATPLDCWPRQWFAVDDHIQVAGMLLARHFCAGDALSRCLAADPAQLWSNLEQSGLRGRGGAGFSSFQKMTAVRGAELKAPRYLVCNADEGEPGTFKDRVLLQRHAEQVFEGMTIAGWAVGAEYGLLYLRGEYAYLYPQLKAALQQRRQQGWLGRDIGGQHGVDFDIEIHLGAGAYVCGEESALIESLEGKRGIPRTRPPFPVSYGYQGRPTLVNNVETFACITEIALTGGQAFASVGTAQSSGSKLHSVSGDCQRPGIYELPWGVTIRQLLQHCGGENAKAVQVGGPSGTLVTADDFQRRLAFEDLSTGGSFMVFGPARDLLAVTRNFVDFFAHESCGFCTPCRAGCQQLKGICQQLQQGNVQPQRWQKVEELLTLMINSSHCGLGKTAALPLQQLQQAEPQRLAGLLASSSEVGFDLQGALAEAKSGRQSR